MNKISSHDYCRNFVREADYPLYLLHFFMPHSVRRDAMSLMALHCELNTIPQKARDPSMIMIRLKWWYDGVMALVGNLTRSESPVFDALKPAIQNQNLNEADFEAYFTQFEKHFKGEETDTEEALYLLLGNMIHNKNDKNRFSKVLQKHDQLDPQCHFRAFRLWLYSIKKN